MSRVLVASHLALLEKHFPLALRLAAKVMDEGAKTHDGDWADLEWNDIEGHMEGHFEGYTTNDFTEDHLANLLCRVLMLVELKEREA